MSPPYPHHFPPAVDANYPAKYGPIPEVPPRPTSFPMTTKDPYHDSTRPDSFSNPFPPGQDNFYNNNFGGNSWGSLKGGPSRVVARYHDMNWDILKRLAMNQQVEVQFSAGGWVVGAVVSCLKFFKCFSGEGYNIRYKTPGGETIERPFPAHPDYIKPVNSARAY